MKKKSFLFLLVIFLSLQLVAEKKITIYNDGFALVKDSIELDLKKGLHSYFLSDIPKTIEENSVIINSENIETFSQNYEYDLADSRTILEKYIGKEIRIQDENGDEVEGILQFFDHKNIGLKDKVSKELILVTNSENQKIFFSSMPDNFFLKPTLHWKLNSQKNRKEDVDYSYLCYGFKWNVTYNAIWDDENLLINPWVTLENESGTKFEDVKLKLVAGDVQKKTSLKKRKNFADQEVMYSNSRSAPSFSEKSFSDYHLYTLSENVSINNKQTKQILLFQPKKVKASKNYVYHSFSQKVNSEIVFENSAENGLGLPLPKGITKIYKRDNADNSLEFIGETDINHTSKNEEVKLTIGSAFDIIGKTKVISTRRIGKKREKNIEISLKNNSEKEVKIFVRHNRYQSMKIIKSNKNFDKKDAYTIEFEIVLKPNSEEKINFTQRTL